MDSLENRLQKRIYVSLYALIFLTALLGLSVLLEGCADTCEETNEFTYYQPVYLALEDLRTSVGQLPPAPIKTVGKIYFKDGYLFINEPNEGIHVIDNRNPAAPVAKSFVNIPGNFELAIKDNTLYADSYIDLVMLDVSNLDNIHEVNRLQNVFSGYNSLGLYTDPVRGVITDWAEQEEVQVTKSACDAEAGIQPWGGVYYLEGIAVSSAADFNKSAAIAPGHGSGPGVGGSMARFTISNDYLYTLDMGAIQPFYIAQATAPQVKDKREISWDMETIFPYGNHLFIGARTGMYIVDITAPDVPTLVTTYTHVNSCDPVVVQGNYAYVTLRSDMPECQGFANQLEVIDIQDISAPQLLEVYPMHSPHGLGIDNNTLFVCDGEQGLKVFDAADVHAIDDNLLAHYNDIHAYDVIPFNKVLMMIGENGLYQYDYSDPQHISLLSHIALAP